MDSSHVTGSSSQLPPQEPRPTKLAELGYSTQPAGTDGQAPGAQSATELAQPQTGTAQRLPASKPATPHDGSLRSRLIWTLRSTEPNKRLGGICNNTISRISYLLLMIGIIAVGWVLSIRAIEASPNSNQSPSEEDPGNPISSAVFVYIAFGVCSLALLIVLHHTVQQALVERHTFAHPLDVLPRYNTYEGDGDTYAPLQTRMRPLWLSGSLREGRAVPVPVVEGDGPAMVGPPPPAYGRTRGSTLLLRGLPALREIEGRQDSSDTPSSPVHPVETAPISLPRRPSTRLRETEGSMMYRSSTEQ
ncbi:hypothetical protein FRB96_003654 [Tulasnella sp. 330]|nr:hypothetical protein FRB96_003654 [Tulasnella sp. 330]KAG8878562.1 hypothetical protein FRB97_002397 [Tulasnella sp. 331]KAG8885719.1 hypothetical protein FRB98_001672 [Tulasnella sp. 332]